MIPEAAWWKNLSLAVIDDILLRFVALEQFDRLKLPNQSAIFEAVITNLINYLEHTFIKIGYEILELSGHMAISLHNKNYKVISFIKLTLTNSTTSGLHIELIKDFIDLYLSLPSISSSIVESNLLEFDFNISKNLSLDAHSKGCM